MEPIYDEIGVGYSRLRIPDARVQAALLGALGSAQTVLNVGAGAGSYEPRDRSVVSVEPSLEMIRQRDSQAAPVVQSVAQELPFANQAFEASMAVLTLHHWPDIAAGLREMRRVTRGPIVLFTFDPASPGFWLSDYLPESKRLDEVIFPSMEEYARLLPGAAARSVPIPRDCTDGFLGAYWARPERYLEEETRSAISTFSKIDARDGLRRLASDLDSGAWHRSYGSLLKKTHLDIGYRLVTCPGENQTVSS